MNSSELMEIQDASKTSNSTELILRLVFICLGLPMNISTFFYMMKRYKHAKSFLLLLHINLNITDILVLGPSLLSSVIWNTNEVWTASDAMCRAMRFVDMFAFMASSNIMVCIALYRLYALRYPLWVSAVGHSRIPRMLVLAWGLAAICSLPQLVVWKVAHSVEGSYCTNTWVADVLPYMNRQLQESARIQLIAYNVGGSLVMFYIPCFILVVCYVLILKDIYATLTCDSETTSVLYMAELTRLSSCGRNSKEKKSDSGGGAVSIKAPLTSLRGQDRFQRTKIRSLRITLFLILCYVITWLPYNMLIWLMVFNFDTYIKVENTLYFLNCLVYLNSVINPFIYGRCQGLKMLVNCSKNSNSKQSKKKHKQQCWILKQ